MKIRMSCVKLLPIFRLELLPSPSSGNGDLDLHTCLDVHNDLFHHLRRSIETTTKVSHVLHNLFQYRPSTETMPSPTRSNPPSPPLRRRKDPTHSIKRLWILISYVSHVLLPSPHGVFRVVTFKPLVGRRTGPLTRRSLVFARSMSSWQTFSSDDTFLLVRVMRILWMV